MSLFELRDRWVNKFYTRPQYLISTLHSEFLCFLKKISMFLMTQKGRKQNCQNFPFVNKVPKYFVVLILVTVAPF